MRICADVDWSPRGAVILTAGKLKFPDVPEMPGVYRLTLASHKGTSVYVGEADRLRRRFLHYRNPGPTQHTNIRMNAAMKAIIESGGSVFVETATDIVLEVNGRRLVADLSERTFRLLAENAALVVAREAGETVENL
jgi:hypothetical protein